MGKRLKTGFFITFEGTEGSGKTTQIRRTASHLRQRGSRVLLLREPGGTRVGEAIRRVLLNRNFKEMKRETELLLYLAARAQLVREKIRPALQKGTVVICDRFEDSTVAYQGFGRGIPFPVLESVSRSLVRGRLRPHLTFVLDLPPRHGLKRGGRRDRIERESLGFHQKVRQGFLRLARKDRRRVVVLDGREGRETTARKIRKVLDRVL